MRVSASSTWVKRASSSTLLGSVIATGRMYRLDRRMPGRSVRISAEKRATSATHDANETNDAEGNDEPMPRERYLRTSEVATKLQVSPKTVARWAKEGRLPYLATLGGHRRFPAA